MADVMEPNERSYRMSLIKSKDTKPEIIVRKHLYAQGFRYRLHKKQLLGKPDLVLKKYDTVILVHGCFWHGHQGCRHHRIPKSRQDYWRPKIQGNAKRDRKNKKEPEKIGWRVITVWTCELESGRKQEVRLKELTEQIIKGHRRSCR